MNILSGPMFQSAEGSIFGKSGAHYNIYRIEDKEGMNFLRHLFPDGKEMNLVFFSTSGVHGHYGTIESCESELGKQEDLRTSSNDITFLMVHPRIVCMKYGNCIPQTEDDFLFLKKLRDSSWVAAQKIGRAE